MATEKTRWLASLLLPLLLCFATISLALAGAVTYTYDAAGRLIKADYGGNTVIYTYDASGNLLRRQSQVSGVPTLTLALNQPAFRPGEQLILTARTTQGPTPANADVYIALQLPGCSSLSCTLFWQGGLNFAATTQPILRNWPISPFNGPIFSYTFGGTEPVGNYVWLGAFAVPGTLNLIGDITLVPFTFSP